MATPNAGDDTEKLHLLHMAIGNTKFPWISLRKKTQNKLLYLNFYVFIKGLEILNKGVPICGTAEMNPWLVFLRMRIQSPALLSRLGSGVASSCCVGYRCSSDLTPSLGTSMCCRCGPEKEKLKRTLLIVLSIKNCAHSFQGGTENTYILNIPQARDFMPVKNVWKCGGARIIMFASSPFSITKWNFHSLN